MLYAEDVENEVTINEKNVVLAVVLEEQPAEEYITGTKELENFDFKKVQTIPPLTILFAVAKHDKLEK